MSTVANNIVTSEMRFTRLQDWLSWQEGLHFTAIELGLDRCRQVAANMGLLDPDFKVISISGTNGKGSSACMLDTILRRSGLRVGTYTSPHLLVYNERISINGKQVNDADLCRSFDRIDKHRGDISLTYFEFGTLAALDIFHSAGLDIAIMEVGLGGRLDAVNILDADIALLTTVDFDHEVWLGHDRESIGREKAGIFRAGRAAVCSDLCPPESVCEHAAGIGAKLYRVGRDFNFSASASSWSWHSNSRHYAALPAPGINRMQIRNAAGVLMVLQLLGEEYRFDGEIIRESLRDFALAGRLQSVAGEIPCILDVAHNPQAISALVDNVNRLPSSGANHLVVGMLRDKNHDTVFKLLQQIADHWYLADIDSDRAALTGELQQALQQYVAADDIARYPSVGAALARAHARAKPGDRIIVTGSFVTVGAALHYLESVR
ncbi:MAG: bifunctional tetrahydrofolate synthase/dihydrofolate synthase [Gammaproteobacteria bacterium]